MDTVITHEELSIIEYLTFNDFRLPLDKSQIIWAPNGVGKSSIYKALQNLELNKVRFVACDDMRKEFVRAVKKKLEISSHTEEIERIEAEKKELIENSGVGERLKDFDLNSVQKLKAALPSYGDLKKDYEKGILDADTSTVQKLITLVGEDGKFFVGHLAQFK